MKTHNIYYTTIVTLALTLSLGAKAEKIHTEGKATQAPGSKGGNFENVNANRKTVEDKSETLERTEMTKIASDLKSAKGIQVDEGASSMTLTVGANGVSETFEGTWRAPTAAEMADLKTDSGLSVNEIFSNMQVKVFEPNEAIKEDALFSRKDSENYLRPSNDVRGGAKNKIFTIGGKVVGGGGMQPGGGAGDKVATGARASEN